MINSPFHAYMNARTLSAWRSGPDRFIPAYASAASIKIYPFQIAAALFAMRSFYQKGVILCDEASLGKTYEAMLVVTQMWYEGKERILIVVPFHLLDQWEKIMDHCFAVPFATVISQAALHSAKEACQDSSQKSVLLTTYDFASQNANEFAAMEFQLSVFDEAHHLKRAYRQPESKLALLKEATSTSFKVLLTATPMENSLLDLYGLIHFIDDTVLPDETTFYNRYFRKPERYQELSERVSPYCFRATRSQVSNYVKLPKRVPITVEYSWTEKEKNLNELLNTYIQKPIKFAFPKMDIYELTLLFTRNVSSSAAAFDQTLRNVLERLESMQREQPENIGIRNERNLFRQMHEIACGMIQNEKSTQLLNAITQGFQKLKRIGANKKALVFTENRVTQKYLYEYLESCGYRGNVLCYGGSFGCEQTVIEQFEHEAQILIATDQASEGFNLEFCSFVINYDLPYNTMTIEQRISRCHRQGQQHDVLVLNFLNRNSFADVRILELINKRILQFGGVFGMPEQMLGNFGVDFSKVLGSVRSKEEVEHAFQEVLNEFENENKLLVEQAEQSLFTSFHREFAEKLTISPNYIERKMQELNDRLWQLTTCFFEKIPQFTIQEDTRTISCVGTPPKVFTGARMGRNEYSMSPNYQPRSGRHTLVGPLAKNILQEIFWRGVPQSGTVKIKSPIEPCIIAYYQISVKTQQSFFESASEYRFAGKTESGKILTDKDCQTLMQLPIDSYTASASCNGMKVGSSQPQTAHDLDGLIDPDDFIAKVIAETDEAVSQQIRKLKAHTEDSKAALKRDGNHMEEQLKETQRALELAETRMDKLRQQKRLACLRRNYKEAEQEYNTHKLRLEQQLAEQIKELLEQKKITTEVKREFVIQLINEHE